MIKQRYLLSLLLAFLIKATFAQTPSGIVPEPVSMTKAAGSFTFTSQVKIATGTNPEVRKAAKIFAGQLATSLKCNLKVVDTPTKESCIALQLNKTENKELGNEGYTLKVNPSGVVISANKPAGIYYGLETFMQLLPTNAEMSKQCKIQSVSIVDYPRFKWRGLMLDVSRHFFSKEFVKKYLDEMAQYKYNVFHWHLSDDAGWRIEIKQYPKLTSVGSLRVPRTGSFYSMIPPQPGEAATDGGYYTQEDIKEIVKYASDRFITIVPEIDIPGHSMGFIASYPQASCDGKQHLVYAGTAGGAGDNVLCAGNEENFTMLSNIFGEIASLFPSEFIHIGGDEVDKSFWKGCPKCQKVMTDNGLKNEHELQSYFIKRVEKIVESKGKKIIGWDEILQGGLAPNAAVMSWQGMEGGIAAAKAGHYVVMTPTSHCYLDYQQGEAAIEGLGGGARISNTYKFEPVPEGVDAKYILGGQGNVWTEFIANERRVEYMTWPRALALSEVYWSPKSKRDWNSFVPRMEAQFERFKNTGVNYAPSVYDPDIYPVKNQDGSIQIGFRTEMTGLDIYYTFDFSFPDNFSAKYDGNPIKAPMGASVICAITYRNGKPVGRLLRINLDDLYKR